MLQAVLCTAVGWWNRLWPFVVPVGVKNPDWNTVTTELSGEKRDQEQKAERTIGHELKRGNGDTKGRGTHNVSVRE